MGVKIVFLATVGKILDPLRRKRRAADEHPDDAEGKQQDSRQAYGINQLHPGRGSKEYVQGISYPIHSPQCHKASSHSQHDEHGQRIHQRSMHTRLPLIGLLLVSSLQFSPIDCTEERLVEFVVGTFAIVNLDDAASLVVF